MSSIQDDNLQLITVDWLRKSARRGASVIERTVDLDTLLRDYRESPIVDHDEQLDRDSVDDLLQFYSLIEVGCIADFLPGVIPEPLTKSARLHLENRFVRRFYEDYHEQWLPIAFRARVGGHKPIKESDSTRAKQAYSAFLMVTWDMEHSKDVEMLLSLLDGYCFGGIRWSHLRKVLRDFKKTASILANEEGNSVLRKATCGYCAFIGFMDDFAALLSEYEDLPLLQSAMWHYHAYWFTHLKGRLGDVLQLALENIFEDWVILNEIHDVDEGTREVKPTKRRRRHKTVEEEEEEQPFHTREHKDGQGRLQKDKDHLDHERSRLSTRISAINGHITDLTSDRYKYDLMASVKRSAVSQLPPL